MKKITDYIPEEVLSSFDKYRNYVEAYFLSNTKEFIYGQKRDNCGVLAIGFFQYMQNKGIDVPRVVGYFKNDNGVYKLLDFYKEDIEEMMQLGYNPELEIDRRNFVKEYGLEERQKEIPHYWNQDAEGNIIDLSGYSQFVKTKLSKDISYKRYRKSKEIYLEKELGYVTKFSQNKKYKI